MKLVDAAAMESILNNIGLIERKVYPRIIPRPKAKLIWLKSKKKMEYFFTLNAYL
jgi:hypothetical protein